MRRSGGASSASNSSAQTPSTKSTGGRSTKPAPRRCDGPPPVPARLLPARLRQQRPPGDRVRGADCGGRRGLGHHAGRPEGGRMNYYNEWDPFAAAWLRELIAAGLVPAGDVDTRSITEVQPDDLAGYTQCHFFAGIGGWSHALQLAGWPTDRPVWTGSCPCQPFSAAGKGIGFADERHLWPAFHWLISQCRPATVFGEQVASAAAWLGL